MAELSYRIGRVHGFTNGADADGNDITIAYAPVTVEDGSRFGPRLEGEIRIEAPGLVNGATLPDMIDTMQVSADQFAAMLLQAMNLGLKQMGVE